MKIISGIYKGRNIKGFDLLGTRPTQNRIKESLFAMINNHIPKSICLDLFSGSGNLGIESLSNGAKYCYFIDNNKDAINVIKDNLKELNITSSQVTLSDWKKALNNYSNMGLKFDIIFVDPPYDYDVYDKILNKVISLNLLKENGLIVLEHSKKTFKNNYPSLDLYKERNYKDKSITIFKKQ